MKGALTFFTLLLISVVGIAQSAPNWVNADYRSGSYPSSQFLVGFAEMNEVNKKTIDEDLSQLEALSKSRLIESVQVEVKSVSVSEVSDFNGDIDDYFNQKTTSESNLQVVGLQTSSYYDKKSKKAYAFSYVSKMKMAEYYRSEIGKNTLEIDHIIIQGKSLLQESQVKQSFKNGLKAYNLFFAISEAQRVLMALGASNEMEIRTQEVNDLNKEFNSYMNSVLTSPNMEMDDLGYIIATGLKKFQGDKHKSIKLEEFTFEQTQLTSDFSFQLAENIRQEIPAEQPSSGYLMKGVFFYKNDKIVVKSSLTDVKSKRVIGKNVVEIPETKLIHEQINIVPKDIKNLALLNDMQITGLTQNAKGKSGFGLDKDLVAYVEYQGEKRADIPVVFKNNNDGTVYCTTLTDQQGNAKCRVKNISGTYKNQVINAEVDLSKFLENDSTEYVKNALNNKSLPQALFKVVVMPSTIYIQAQENNFGESLDVKLIEPQIKENLSGHGFEFSSTDDQVDYVIKIRASSRKGGNVSGVYFAFVDVSISIYDNQKGKEIYKESITNVKGGGGTFEQAGGKAFYKASEQARDQVVSVLLK